jgi:hypothetical protein
MPKLEEIKIGEKTFIARSLTVNQVLNVIDPPRETDLPIDPTVEITDEEKRRREEAAAEKARKELERNIIRMLFVDAPDPRAFYSSLQIGYDDIKDLTPEDVKLLMEAVARVNPHYAEMDRALRNRLEDFRKILSGPVSA